MYVINVRITKKWNLQLSTLFIASFMPHPHCTTIDKQFLCSNLYFKRLFVVTRDNSNKISKKHGSSFHLNISKLNKPNSILYIHIMFLFPRHLIQQQTVIRSKLTGQYKLKIISGGKAHINFGGKLHIVKFNKTVLTL